MNTRTCGCDARVLLCLAQYMQMQLIVMSFVLGPRCLTWKAGVVVPTPTDGCRPVGSIQNLI